MKKICTVLAIAVLALALASGSASAATLKAGDAIPESLKFKTLDGGEVTVKSVIKDKPSVLVFFNTSCRNCLNEIKWLMRKYKDRNNVLISIDLAGAPAVQRYQKQYMKDYMDIPIYLDQEFAVPISFGLSVTPSSVLVGKDGVVTHVFSGYDKSSEEAIAELYK
ncbi:MAG: TlpA disulfide reductase family protein [bacterium]|nr:TlpA disulfide reductase family protein [bacterium]